MTTALEKYTNTHTHMHTYEYGCVNRNNTQQDRFLKKHTRFVAQDIRITKNVRIKSTLYKLESKNIYCVFFFC